MKKYFSISALALLSVLCFSVTFSSCDKDDEGSGSIVGTWTAEASGCSMSWTFSANGSGSYLYSCDGGYYDTIRWSTSGNRLTIDEGGDPYTIRFEVDNNKLYMYFDGSNYLVLYRD